MNQIRDLCHKILLYYYAETKEMIHESVNLKGAVYKPKQNSFCLQFFSFELFRSFIKFTDWALNKFSIELNTKPVQSSANRFYYCTVKGVNILRSDI